jgi:hypothetical protein
MDAKKRPRGSYEFYLIQTMAENLFFSSSSTLSQAGFLELCAQETRMRSKMREKRESEEFRKKEGFYFF